MSICSLIGVPLAISVPSPMKMPIIAAHPFALLAYRVKPCGPQYSLSRLATRLLSIFVKDLLSVFSSVCRAMRTAAARAAGLVPLIDGDGVKDEALTVSGARPETNAADENISQLRGEVLRVLKKEEEGKLFLSGSVALRVCRGKGFFLSQNSIGLYTPIRENAAFELCAVKGADVKRCGQCIQHCRSPIPSQHHYLNLINKRIRITISTSTTNA